ncbi:hypothetical protein OR1_01626 [Geobacter sp. OR-1]|uniref:hypothetical protein n=1 Tax=Geobacter sp. OR-1 TaxID=1266765 RepID=UPI00054210D9|nr:hypothetical protein [Geobacter sp. OR-1]GAM09351.1 hypothetical protein OR1_01626 [Geobacter sp. OR-1]
MQNELAQSLRQIVWRRRAGKYIELGKQFIERNKDLEVDYDLKWFLICQELELLDIEFPVIKSTLNIEIDIRRSTTEDINRYFDDIIKPLKEEALRQRAALVRSAGMAAPFFAFDSIEDSTGRKRDWNEVFLIWEKCLKIYDLFQEQKLKGKTNMAEIARQIGWFPDEPDADNRCYPSRKIKKYLSLAERLIKAAGNGTFATEAVKPLP